MKCLLLGYSRKKTKLINFLKKKKIKVVNRKNKLILSDISKYDLIISFGYRKIIKNNILNKLEKPILNLHMSFLPHNRGAHPNFWSFYDNTKKGVTIHEIDKGVDTGPIIFKKEIKFNIHKNKKLTFKDSYKILFSEMEKLFMKNYKSLISGKYKTKENNKIKGSFHRKTDLPKDINTWDTSIYHYLNK
tara:strand:- start:15043 stop:15609 length:567 start_codon:yes stop_codon:yes gene_type:complete